MPFEKAARKRVSMKMGITGPSGSGKTFSALQIGFGLAGESGRVAVVDTENGSASLYAHLGEYDVLELRPPFTVDAYREAIGEAAQAGYAVLIIDSISHEWAGDGGLLSRKESLDARGGNAFANWSKISPLHEQFKSALLQAPMHVIVTLRSKQEYVMQEDGKGRCVPVKVGLTPIQREGFEYELSLVFDISMSHEAHVGKDRTGLFDGFVGRLSGEHGRRIREWLESAPEAAPSPGPTQSPDTAADTASALREAKIAFAEAAREAGQDIAGEGGRPSLSRMRALLERTLGREVTGEPGPSDWQAGRERLLREARDLSDLHDPFADGEADAKAPADSGVSAAPSRNGHGAAG